MPSEAGATVHDDPVGVVAREVVVVLDALADEVGVAGASASVGMLTRGAARAPEAWRGRADGVRAWAGEVSGMASDRGRMATMTRPRKTPGTAPRA